MPTPHDETSKGFHSLRNQFLIAMPGLEDSIFSHSLTYICDHNEHGAMGFIVNQTLGLTLGSVFDQLDLDGLASIRDQHVLAGGPVNLEQGVVLHRDKGNWDATASITSDFHLTSSRDIIDALAAGKAPPEAQLALGYAGWGEGQLEEELSKNYWLTTPADTSIVFDYPVEERWNAVANQLGIDLNLITNTVGHA